MRIDYVSPLPPVRSGISDYSLDLLPHLAAKCDLRVVRLPDQPLAPEVEERFRPVAAAELGAGGRLPLYQMGNNLYHEAVRALALERPGVLTLHDLVLHHLLLEITLGREVFPPYLDALRGDHGWIGEAVALPKRWGGYGDAPTFELPAHRTLLRRQRGVLVHNRWSEERIRREDPEIRVRTVPMGVPLPPPADPPEGAASRAFRRRFGLPEHGVVLGSFGFQTPIKRTLSAIAALGRPGLEDLSFLVVGQASADLDLEGEARRAGVADRVRVTGFLGFDDFQAAIAATDLCLNLRYPTAGETSASLLRILAVGRPAIVSDHAQFGELPAEVVARVPVGEGEVETLAVELRRLAASAERRRAMGEAAREHVRRHHDPAAAAGAVVDACREWAEQPPPGDRPPRVAPPTSIAWGELPGRLEVEGAARPWPAGERRRLRLRLANAGPATWLAGRSGPGGVAVEVRLLAGGVNLAAGEPWLPLPHDVAAGEDAVLEVEVRRPPGEARLAFVPRLMGGAPLPLLGGPGWEEAL